MNERIKVLAEQAGFIDRGTNHTAYMNFDHEKFAELIVKECANEILKWKSEPFPYDPEFGAKLIKEHFGIKE